MRKVMVDKCFKPCRRRYTSGKAALTFEGHTTEGNGGVESVAFSPDGKWVASAQESGPSTFANPATGVKMWDAATGKEVVTLKWKNPRRGLEGPGRGRSVAFSPDGKRLASGSSTG